MIVRWVCEKDNKKWLYPIEKCVYCMGPITKQRSSNAKIIGITRVNIQSPMHPITPYSILLLEDEKGNRMPKKTMREYKVGDSYVWEKAKTDSAVALAKIKYDIGEALRESLGLLNSFDIGSEDKILITPTVIEPSYAYQAVNTNPKLLNELIMYLKEKGVKDIKVAAQASQGNDTASSAKKSGLIDVCKKREVEMVDLSTAEYEEKEVDGMKLRIAKEALQRKVINAPVMKTHQQLGISGAMENLLRLLDAKSQNEIYAFDVEKNLPKLARAIPTFVNVGDATIGMHAEGPTVMGEPAFLNILVASKNPASVDSAFAAMGMLEKPRYLREAESLGLEGAEIKSTECVGDELEASKLHLKPASNKETFHPKIKLIDGKANPKIFNSAIKTTQKLLGLAGYDTHLAIGKFLTQDMVEGKKRVVGFGKDACERLKELGINPVAEITEETDPTEALVTLKSILEDPDKTSLSFRDKAKSKMSSFGMKLKKKISG